MTGFNYLGGRRRPALTADVVLAIDNRIRGPLAALAATLVVTVSLCVVALVRLHVARHAYTVAMERLAGEQPAVDRVIALEADIHALALAGARADAVRGMSLRRADELVSIANHLPANVWLRGIHFEDGAYILDGTARRPADVGAALNELHDATAHVEPQLVMLHVDAGTGRVEYQLRLPAPR